MSEMPIQTFPKLSAPSDIGLEFPEGSVYPWGTTVRQVVSWPTAILEPAVPVPAFAEAHVSPCRSTVITPHIISLAGNVQLEKSLYASHVEPWIFASPGLFATHVTAPEQARPELPPTLKVCHW